MIAGETAERRGAAPPPYIERFGRLGPTVSIAVGGVAIVSASIWLVLAAHSARLGDGPPALALLLAGIGMVGFGLMRFARGRSKHWIAFAIDANGVYFAHCVHPGSEPDGLARRIPWDEINALILFSRRTEFLRGTVECVGVRLNPSVAGSPEDHFARLRQILSRPDIELHVWEQLRELDGDLPEARMKTAVSLHTEVRGWSYRRSRVMEAVRAHAPGVPVIGFTADDYYHLVGWRAGQEKLRELLQDAELRRWGW
ncbi:hypothetical protein [Actinoallomurus soli]|uniref:hypothetical protein n=1 Tax=Actinoallomurus soli TaxID=2952535 RepID=UPI002093D79E|nr:hypothetical protein [Actinoallomurus soli]MCO5973284.1 hypothetical protein [Actinoallomurus soli]